MKTYKLLSLAIVCLSISFVSSAQKATTEDIKVSGNCGMCKKKIETAAKNAGATYAAWSADSKVLTVKYNSKSTNNAKIQEAVAKSGYDTEKIKASDEAYNNLHACCKYERADVKKAEKCCSDECEMKDGKCKDEADCKEKGCCKDSEACKAMGCCSHEHAAGAKMNCSKKEGDAKMDCCKKQ